MLVMAFIFWSISLRLAHPESADDTLPISHTFVTNMKNNILAGNIVETQDLTKTFGEDIAVQSLNMQVPNGTIFGFVGPSGCGKTTTVRLLTGFYEPTSGTLSVLGKNPADFSDSDREKIGYLIQQFVLYPDLTVWENLNFQASFYGVGLFRGRHLK